jgi:predicted ribosome quality control (RQC) complex YloA/Tae2 family protein
VTDYPAPAGGCLLTDVNYSRRLKDLFDHQERVRESDLELLKYGRHFRLDAETKMVVGRTQSENHKIVDHHDPEAHALLKLHSYPGPTVLISCRATPAAFEQAAAICVGYSKAPTDQETDVLVTRATRQETLRVRPLAPDQIAHLLI